LEAVRGEAVVVAEVFEQRKVASAVVAEAEVLADHDVGGAQGVDEASTAKNRRGCARHVPVEAQDEDGSAPRAPASSTRRSRVAMGWCRLATGTNYVQ
jgi:hypothetical protein